MIVKKEDIDALIKNDPATATPTEAVLCSPGLHALWAHRIEHALWKRGWRLAARAMATITRMITGVEIHPGAKIGRRVVIDHGMGTVIGETAEIGDDCVIYQGVALGGTANTRGMKRHPTLGKGVMVGCGAKVLGPILIPDGTRIGANAVVTKAPAEEGLTLVGIPARALEKKQ